MNTVESSAFEESLTPDTLSALMRSTWTWDDRALRRDLAILLVDLDAARHATPTATDHQVATLRARAHASGFFGNMGLAWQTLDAVTGDSTAADEYPENIGAGAISATLAAAEQAGSRPPRRRNCSALPARRMRSFGAHFRARCCSVGRPCPTSGCSNASASKLSRLSEQREGAFMPADDKSAPSPPATRRGKPPNLTEKQIVDAALEIIRLEGLEALSMRRLSRALDRSAMAPYWYVADKQQLLDLVAKEVLSDVLLPAIDSGSWEERLRRLVEDIDAHLRQHPGIAEILFARMQSTDRRVVRGIMEILLSAGFSDTDVLLGYATIHTYLFGRYQVVMRAEWEQPQDVDDELARLVALVPGLGGRDFFAFGVDTIIDGLRARLSATESS